MKNPSLLEADFAGGDYMLMKNLARQQPDALAALHSRYHSLMHHVALQIVHDDADADDVVQEVFLQLWTRPETYRAAKGRPLGWLLTLARRRAIDCVRRRCAYRRATERFEGAQQFPGRHASGDPSITRDGRGGDLRAYLNALLKQLPPAQQVVVERGFFDGMSQRQIARTMKVPLGTVKTRMELGLRKLAHAVVPHRAQIE